MKYIKGKIYGLPKPYKIGYNTSHKKRINKEYVHKVEIYGFVYYKVHLKRSNVSKIKYFKKLKDAKLFVDMLRLNRYL